MPVCVGHARHPGRDYLAALAARAFPLQSVAAVSAGMPTGLYWFTSCTAGAGVLVALFVIFCVREKCNLRQLLCNLDNLMAGRLHAGCLIGSAY